MPLDTEFEEFRALPILLQHRKLIAQLDAIADLIESASTRVDEENGPARLLLLVSLFIQTLPEHFATEEKSTNALLRDCADLEFRRRLLALDSEHPQLLESFQAGSRRLSAFCNATESTALEPILSDLKRAIAAFRKHEAAEDELFVE